MTPAFNCWLLIGLHLMLLLKLQPSASECSDNCLYGSDFCGKDGSSCIYGCKDGYIGSDCRENCTVPSPKCVSCELDVEGNEICSHCQNGYYGDRCQYTCSQKCILKKCNQLGNCIYGCVGEYFGSRCEQLNCSFDDCLECKVTLYPEYVFCRVCVPGKFWDHMSNRCVNCSSHCIENTPQCNSTTGLCLKGCKDGWYGSNCDKPCTVKNCEICTDGFIGVTKVTKCSQCKPGWYVDNDQCVLCSSQCQNGCDPIDGYCIGGCKTSFYGQRCEFECPFNNCDHCSYDKNAKLTCTNCSRGYFWHNDGYCKACPNTCRNSCEKMSDTCIDGCQAGYFGRNCLFSCGKCKDNVVCRESDGNCPDGCKEGWYGDRCDRNCPTHCLTCNGFNETDRCSSCEAGTFGRHCEKSCSRFCQSQGNYNFIYCNQDSGACDYGCRDGYFGEACIKKCPENCLLGRCLTNGQCESCVTGHYYGDYCNKTCPPNCDSNYCDRNGLCNSCLTGYIGDKCETKCVGHCLDGYCNSDLSCSGKCQKGYYGQRCEKPCHTNCVDQECHHSTGRCIKDCPGGFYGSQCTEVCASGCLKNCSRDLGWCGKCKSGLQGKLCKQACGYCDEVECDQDTGTCLKGCLPGWKGQKCEDECSPGYFGPNCDSKCGNCLNGEACDIQNGTCLNGCEGESSGSQCISVQGAPIIADIGLSSDKLHVIIGSGAGLLLLVLILLVILLVRKYTGNSQCSQPWKQKPTGKPEQQKEIDGKKTEKDLLLMASHLQDLPNIDVVDLQLQNTCIKGHFFDVKEGLVLKNEEHNAVIIKQLIKDGYPRIQADFRHDAEVSKELGLHENILKVIGFCETERHLMSVFDLTCVTDLQTYLRNIKSHHMNQAHILLQACPELENFFEGIINALAYLKDNEIIHRLVASFNIYFGANFVPQVTNFQFAIKNKKTAHSNTKLPHQFSAWIPPEIWKNNSHSHKTDIWGFGVLLWEVATLGKTVLPAFVQPTESSTKSDKSNSLRRKYLTAPNPCDPALERWIQMCLRRNPRARPDLSHLKSMMIRSAHAQIHNSSDLDGDIDGGFTLERTTAV